MGQFPVSTEDLSLYLSTSRSGASLCAKHLGHGAELFGNKLEGKKLLCEGDDQENCVYFSLVKRIESISNGSDFVQFQLLLLYVVLGYVHGFSVHGLASDTI